MTHAKLKSRTPADKRDNSDYFVTMTEHSRQDPDGLAAASDARGLEALIARPVFYELAEMAKPEGDVWGVSSNGAFFPIASPGAAPA